MQIHHWCWETPGEIEGVFSKMLRERAGALVIHRSLSVASDKAGGSWNSQKEPSADNLGWHSICRTRRVNAGGRTSYGANRNEPYRRVAVYVDKILKGAKPAELPVEQPTKFDLVINLKAAKQIGLTIPPNVLARADRVIK